MLKNNKNEPKKYDSIGYYKKLTLKRQQFRKE